MATRFGASSPAQTYATKVRWLVGFLIAVVVLLFLTLFYVVQGGGGEQSASTELGVEAIQAASGELSPTTKILYANQRIEEGVQMTEAMFSAWDVPSDRIPEGAMKETQKAEVVGKFSQAIISANVPILRDSLGEAKKGGGINIPAGYRAVTINISARSGVSGWAKPNSRVDVLWAYTDKNSREKKVSTIVRFAKVLSVGGNNQSGDKAAVNQQGTTATLLVTKREAKKIELARTLGSLTLSLVGQQEEVVGDDASNDVVDISDLTGIDESQVGEAEEEPNDGVMYSTDPRTGKKTRYVLKNNRWVPDKSY
jgi:pilus assembly protein CpaB